MAGLPRPASVNPLTIRSNIWTKGSFLLAANSVFNKTRIYELDRSGMAISIWGRKLIGSRKCDGRTAPREAS